MANISGPDGKVIPIDDAELAAKYGSGELVPNSPIPMLDPSGNPQLVDPDQVQNAIRNQWKPTTHAIAKDLALRQEAANHPLEAGGLAFAGGLVPFARTAIAKGGGPSLEQQKYLAEGNPVISPILQGAGNVTQALGIGALTGGLGAGAAIGEDLAGAAGKGLLEGAAGLGEGATAAAEGAGALGEGAAAVAPATDATVATAKALAAGAPKVPPPTGLAARAAAAFDPVGAAGQAVLFGAQGVQNNLSEREIGDPAAQSESMLHAGLSNAALGFFGDIGLQQAAEFIPNPFTKVMDLTSKASDKLTDMLGSATAALRSDITEQTGKEAAEQGVKGIQEQAFKAGPGSPSPRTVVANNEVRELGKTMDKLGDATADMVNEHYDVNRPKEMEKNIGANSEMNLTEAKQYTKNLDESLIQPGQVELNGGAAKEYFDRGQINHVNGLVEDFRSAYENADSIKDISNAGRKLGQYLDHLKDFEGNATGLEERTRNAIIDKIRQPIYSLMENDAIFGKAEVAAHLASNKAFTDLKNASDGISKVLGVDAQKVGGRAGDVVIKGSKMQTLIKNIALGKISAEEGKALLDNYLGAVRQFADVSAQTAKNAGQTVDHSALKDVLSDVVKGRNQAVAAQALAHTPIGAGAVSAIRDAAFAHLGGPVGQAAFLAGQVWRNAKNPAMAAEVLGYMKSAAEKQGKAIASGIGKFMTSQPVRTAINKTMTMGALEGDRTFNSGAGKGPKPEQAFNQRADEIRNLASSPTLVNQRLEMGTQKFRDGGFPLHAQALKTTALNKLQVLAQALPPPPPAGMLPQDKHEAMPDPMQVAAFERTYSVVKDPVGTITGSMQEGTLTPDMVAAAAQASPHTLQAIRQAVTQKLLDMPKTKVLSYEQKQAISTLLGTPVSPDLAPDQIAFQQSAIASAQGSMAHPGPGKQKKPRAAGLDKLTFSEDTAFGAGRMENARES
jgi:hypothetical protein